MWHSFAVLPLAVSPFGFCEDPYLNSYNQFGTTYNSQYQNGNVYDDGQVRVVDETGGQGGNLKSAAQNLTGTLNNSQINELKGKITADVLSLGDEAEDFAADLLNRIRSEGDNGGSNNRSGSSRRGDRESSGSNGTNRSGSNGGFGSSNGGGSTTGGAGRSGGNSGGGAGGSSGCRGEAEPKDGGILGEIPDTWYCQVFGEVPTFDELWGSN